ncbi:MAG TPA: DegT/DnrJ/EryC1/StrS family aminotransferase [Candidatus Saccharimonadales bacterium]
MDNIFVTQPLLPPIEDFIAETKDIFESKWLTNMGKKHQELEEKLKDFLKVRGISLTVNGHMALELSIQALELKDAKGGEGEVITTPFTFISTTHSIVRNGLKPVFADIDFDTCCITPETIEPLINKNTVAIMPVHVYGNVCDVVGIETLAKKYNLMVIYDAAHTFGVEVKIDGKTRGIGSFGDVSIFSFHATKVFNTIEGGAVCFNDESLYKKLYNLKDFGIRYGDPDYIEGIGANAKMSEFSAAMGICNLRYIDDALAKRNAISELYKEMLGSIKGITLPTINDSRITLARRNNAYMPIVFNSEVFGQGFRDRVKDALAENNIFARKYFYPLTNDAQCYEGQFSSKGINGSNPTPVAHKLANEVLTLPIYANLDLADVERICEIIKKTVKKHGK